MRLNKSLIFVFGFGLSILAILGYFFYDYSKHKQESIVKDFLDTQIKELFEKISQRQELASSIALLLANNRDIKSCLQDIDKKECKNYLKELQSELDTLSFFENMKIHVHTKEFRSFLRVWDLENSTNDVLISFRESLQQAKAKKKSIWGVEVGRFSLLIRGISPIFLNDEYIGSVEVVSDFETITKYFKQKNIDLFVLMNREYEKIASKVEYPSKKRFDEFIIVNDVNSGLDLLRDVEFKETSFKKINNFYFVYTPIYDISNNYIGFYILKIPISKLF